MNAMKTILFLSLAVNLVLGWMLWRNQSQLRTQRHLIADAQRESRVMSVAPSQGTYGSNDSAPKLDAPDGIKATIEPTEPSPFANAGLQVRGVSQSGAARFEMRDVKNPTASEDSVEFNDSTWIRTDWQTPPRLNLNPGGLSTPFSKPDWYDHPPWNRPIDERLLPKPRGM